MSGCRRRWTGPGRPWPTRPSSCSTSTSACRQGTRSAATNMLGRLLLDRLPVPAAAFLTFDVDGPDPVGGLPRLRRGDRSGGWARSRRARTRHERPRRDERARHAAGRADPHHRPRAVDDGRRPSLRRRSPTDPGRHPGAGRDPRRSRDLAPGQRRPQGGHPARPIDGPVTTDVPASLLRGHPGPPHHRRRCGPPARAANRSASR